MATPLPPQASPANQGQGLQDLLVCPVCLEAFKDPKTLACLHSFCQQCLENCRRPYRRDISCPVCKKVTALSSSGVAGLQSDFRIQQIRDLLSQQEQAAREQAAREQARAVSPPRVESPVSTIHEERHCDVCRTQSKATGAINHCVQCCMYFCRVCFDRHQKNTLFSNHHVIDVVTAGDAATELYCKTHPDYTVRYFCRSCSGMLCTVCTLEHNPEHKPVTLDKEVIAQYQTDLQDTLKTLGSKLSEVKKKAKYLETLKQCHQKALYEAQRAIRAKTDEVIAKIKEQERQLLYDVQQKMEERLKQVGLDTLGEINFHRSAIEMLHQDVQTLIQSSPQKCMVSYTDLVTRTKAVTDAPLPAVGTDSSAKTIVKFVPSDQSQVAQLLGQLQECSLSNDDSCDEPSSPDRASTSYAQLLASSSSPSTRLGYIRSALVSSRPDVKIGKVKAIRSPDRSKSPNAINADDLIGSTTSGPDLIVIDDDTSQGSSSGLTSPTRSSGATSPVRSAAMTSPSLSRGVTSPTLSGGAGSPVRTSPRSPLRPLSPLGLLSPASPGSPAGATAAVPSTSTDVIQATVWQEGRLLFKKDEVGGWPGKIMSPTSVSFIKGGNNDVAVAENDSRIQIFDSSGSSKQIIGWGADKFKPQSVCSTRDGKICITDKSKKCVTVYKQDGELLKTFGVGFYTYPGGCAVAPSGNVVVSDIDKNCIVVHGGDGGVLTQFGSWGGGDYQFNSPQYLTVNHKEEIIVSDTSNNCIKVFDMTGKFLRKFNSVGKHGALRRPHGVVCDSRGDIFVCDRDNHRVGLFSNDGTFQGFVLTKADGLRYPVDVSVTDAGLLAVVETHVGFLSKDPHHALKVFSFKIQTLPIT